MLNKLTRTRLITALAALLGVSATPLTSALAETIDYIKERRELIACVSPRAEPYSDAILQIERPGYAGFHINLAKKLAEKIGVGLKLNWVQPFFNREKVDCDLFMGLAKFKEDTPHPFLKKSIPYMQVEDLFVAKKDHGLKGLKDFNGLRVAADTSTAAQDILRKQNSGAELFVSYIEDDKKLRALQEGAVDIAVVTTVSLGWYRKNHPDFAPVTTSTNIIADNSAYQLTLGLHRADEQTLTLFNDYLKEMLTNGTIARILNHYGLAETAINQ